MLLIVNVRKQDGNKVFLYVYRITNINCDDCWCLFVNVDIILYGSR